jgi:hypothetical protein
MSDDSQTTTDDLSDAVRRALQAAAVANDAADEFAALSAKAETAVLSATAAQKRSTAVASGALGGAILVIGLSSLVYLRSVGDLREAAALQAAATKATIEQVHDMQAAIHKAEETVAGLTVLRDQMGAQFDGLGDRIKGDIESLAANATTMQPQVATAIQDHVDASLNDMRGQLMAALAEMEMSSSTAGGIDADTKMLLKDLRDRLSKPSPSPAKAPAKAPVSTTRKSTAAKPAPKPAKAPFSFP